jgi:hypothetical protein
MGECNRSAELPPTSWFRPCLFSPRYRPAILLLGIALMSVSGQVSSLGSKRSEGSTYPKGSPAHLSDRAAKRAMPLRQVAVASLRSDDLRVNHLRTLLMLNGLHFVEDTGGGHFFSVPQAEAAKARGVIRTDAALRDYHPWMTDPATRYTRRMLASWPRVVYGIPYEWAVRADQPSRRAPIREALLSQEIESAAARLPFVVSVFCREQDYLDWIVKPAAAAKPEIQFVRGYEFVVQLATTARDETGEFVAVKSVFRAL